MADTKTSDETAATALTGAELLRLVQSAASVKTTAALMAHQFRGARARMTSDDTAQNVTTVGTISFDAAQFDTDSFWAGGAPTRLTVPANVAYVELWAQVFISSSTASTYASAYIVHFNSADVQQRAVGFRHFDSGATSHCVTVATGPLAVSSGDYFTLVILEESDNSVTIEGNDTFETFMTIRVLGMTP